MLHSTEKIHGGLAGRKAHHDRIEREISKKQN